MKKHGERSAYLLAVIGAMSVGSSIAADTPSHPLAAEDIVHALQACIAESDDARRLACYDRTLQRPPAAARTTPEQRFGLSPAQVIQKEHLPASPRNVTATVVAVSREPGGALKVALANGQVWAQQNADGQELPITVGDPVTVSHEIMGAYLLTSPASGHRSMRVRRVK